MPRPFRVLPRRATRPRIKSALLAPAIDEDRWQVVRGRFRTVWPILGVPSSVAELCNRSEPEIQGRNSRFGGCSFDVDIATGLIEKTFPVRPISYFPVGVQSFSFMGVIGTATDAQKAAYRKVA